MYENLQDKVSIAVRFESETFWLTQKAMAELFNTKPQNITLYLKNIFDNEVLEIDVTSKDNLQVQLISQAV